MSNYNQWTRKVGLFVTNKPETGSGAEEGDLAIDLSAFRIKFEVRNADTESPNNSAIRVYNLTAETIKRIRGEFSQVILNAGYENGNYGIIFKGTIKQFRIGKESATDSYLDILAADGDIGYNQGVVNKSFGKGITNIQTVVEVAKDFPGLGLDYGSLTITKQNFPNIRGVVLMGMARARMRHLVSNLDSSWSIQNGTIVVTENSGYQEGEAVKINMGTGLIGVPEQTDGGIKVKCLLNCKIRIGGRVQLNNKEIVQLLQQSSNGAPISYASWGGFQAIAAINGDGEGDGMYRAFAVEHVGDTRGNEWYTELTCLSVNETTERNESVAPE